MKTDAEGKITFPPVSEAALAACCQFISPARCVKLNFQRKAWDVLWNVKSTRTSPWGTEDSFIWIPEKLTSSRVSCVTAKPVKATCSFSFPLTRTYSLRHFRVAPGTENPSRLGFFFCLIVCLLLLFFFCNMKSAQRDIYGKIKYIEHTQWCDVYESWRTRISTRQKAPLENSA